MMKRYVLLFAFCINTIHVGTASAITLVTESEVADSADAPMMTEAVANSSDIPGPEIVVINPDTINKTLKNPFTVEVMFKSIEGSSIDTSSFKAFYGSFNLDITDRLLKESKMTPTGFKLSNINVPNGNHKITLFVKDNMSRQCEKILRFKIE
jgi:hypothetical protein